MKRNLKQIMRRWGIAVLAAAMVVMLLPSAAYAAKGSTNAGSGNSNAGSGEGTYGDLNIEAYESDSLIYWDLNDEDEDYPDESDYVTAVTLNEIPVQFGESTSDNSSDWTEGNGVAASTYFPSEKDGASTGTEYELTITPADGYYVTSVVVACVPSPNGSYKNAYQCSTWKSENAYTTTFTLADLTDGSVSTTVTNEAFAHDGYTQSTSGEPAVYFILIEVEKVPTPAYVEYDYGEIVDLLEEAGADTSAFETASGWTSANSGNVYTSTDTTTGGGILTENTQYKYTYKKATEDSSDWVHYTNTLTQAAIDAAASIGYEFAGWALTYYDDCTAEKSSGSYNNYDLTFSGVRTEGTVDVGISVPIIGHLRLVALWVADEDYVPDCGGDDEKTNSPGLTKKIMADGEELDSYSVAPGENVTFALKSNVPDYLGNYVSLKDSDGNDVEIEGQEYRGSYVITFHDVLDDAFTLIEDSITVTVNGKTLASSLYTVSVSNDDGCDLEVSMDLIEIYETGKYFTWDEIEDCPEIVVTYQATLSGEAEAGCYPNKAWVTYEDGQTPDDEVDVYVYDLKIFKFDQEGVKDEDGNLTYTPLANAVFSLYSSKDCADEDLIATLTTDEEGYATFAALAAGTYYLKEVSAPEGYVTLSTVTEVTIGFEDDGSYSCETVFLKKIANSKIPTTGGIGTMLFTIAGAVLIFAALSAVIVRRRRGVRA